MNDDWIEDDDAIIKNKPLNSLPPTNHCETRISSPNLISKEVEKYRIVQNQFHNKKLPISFISPKDWQKYLNFTKSVTNKLNCETSILNSRGKNGRILRLLNSFHKLYEEYSELFISSDQCVLNYGDNRKISQLNICNTLSNIHNESIPDSYDSVDESFLDVGVQTTITMDQIKLSIAHTCVHRESCTEKCEKLSLTSDLLVPWGVKNILNPAKRFSRKLRLFTHSNGKHKNTKVFDKIEKLENNLVLEVIEEVHQQSIVCHSLLLDNYENKYHLPKIKYLQIPLAVELLLPKIQTKIENILNDCPFLCDPLEVAAELRHFGYDQNACTKYFKITKSLRSVIEEIMPVSNTESYSYQTATLQTPNRNDSIKSVKSQIISNDLINETPNAIKDYNSNVNHYMVENLQITTDIPNNIIPDSINECPPFSQNNTPVNKPGTLVTIDNCAQTNIIHLCMENKNIETIFNKIKTYFTVVRQLHAEAKDEIEYLHKQLICVFTALKNHMALLVNQNNEKSFSDEQKSKMVTLSRQVEELKLKLKKEEKKRRHAYNLMQEQMGNIRVYCRCRHVTDGGNILEFIGSESITLQIAPNERFEFDKVFHPGMSQIELYEEFRPLVMSFIDGYNVCFITYGGEASGKTFTLIGGNEGSSQHGLMQRALTTILTEERLRQRDCEYKITACVVEIYNDNCIDVLSGETNIQLYVDNGMETAYQKLKSVPITNEADAEALMQVCKVKRKVARTALNPASSRSHLITLIRLQGKSKIHGENICSFLCLCDLAGFEDIIKAETQTNKVLSKEAGYINRSLTAFNRVFVSLRKQDPNTVSYRETKLTHLLKPFLTNSGKCALIITVRNDKRSLGSTQNTLRFGRETRGVSLGKARRQVNLNGQVSLV